MPKKSILEDDDLNDLESFLTRRESSSSSDLEDIRKKNVKKAVATAVSKPNTLRRTSSNLSSNSESDFKEELPSQKEIKKSPSVSSLTSYTITSSDNDSKSIKLNKTVNDSNSKGNKYVLSIY